MATRNQLLRDPVFEEFERMYRLTGRRFVFAASINIDRLYHLKTEGFVKLAKLGRSNFASPSIVTPTRLALGQRSVRGID